MKQLVIDMEVGVKDYPDFDRSKRYRPPLKWAGSKWDIACKVLSHLPRAKTLIEPFCGSCAVSLYDFQELKYYDRHILNDVNPKLIRLYHAIQSDLTSLLCDMSDLWDQMNLFEDKEGRQWVYNALRDEFNEDPDPALFMALNKFGFNGLYREGKTKGNFNVPFGGMRNPSIPYGELYTFEDFSRRSSFHAGPYQNVVGFIDDDCVIYCDPPYVPESDTANFTSYSKDGFTVEDQHELASFARFLAERGTPVFISNSEASYDIYSPGVTRVHRIEARRSISCNGSGRGKVTELLFEYS